MYPWLRVMYAVVVIGSRMRRSACGMNLSTFCACANADVGRQERDCGNADRGSHRTKQSSAFAHCEVSSGHVDNRGYVTLDPEPIMPSSDFQQNPTLRMPVPNP